MGTGDGEREGSQLKMPYSVSYRREGQVGGPVNPFGGREEVPRVIPTPKSSLVETASGTSCSGQCRSSVASRPEKAFY